MIPFRAISFGLGVIGLLSFTHHWAYRAGRDASDANHAQATAAQQREIFDVTARSSVQAAALDVLRQKADQATMEFEDEARNDPDAALRVPDADSLRRLETLWQRAGSAP